MVGGAGGKASESTAATTGLLAGIGASAASVARSNPRSSSVAIFLSRHTRDWPPRITAMMRLPSRSAEAARFQPAARVNPVFNPSTPL
jgi:hypothetical protein